MASDDSFDPKQPAYSKEPDKVRAQVLSEILQEYDVLKQSKGASPENPRGTGKIQSW